MNNVYGRWLLSGATMVALSGFGGGAPVSGQMLDRTDSRVQTTLDVGWRCLGTLRPRGVGEIASQNWALGCETLDRDYIDYDLYREYLVPLGIKKIRLQAGWAKTEQVAGTHDFRWLDAIVDDALGRGLEILLETGYGNPIYEGGGGKDLAGGFPTSVEALAAWDRWVAAMARRYRGKVRDWAMWNEPDINKKHQPSDIADFNIRTAEIIRKNIPEARIGALSLASIKPEFLDRCLARIAGRGKLDLFEWVIYHGYTMNPDDAYANVERMREVVREYSPRLKMWQGENGCPSERATRFALSNHDWSELTQAKWNARRMLGDLGRDIPSSVFTICDFDHTGREINRKGLLKINDKTSLAKVKMAYYTVQNVVSLFDGTLARQASHPAEIRGESPVTSFAYRGGRAGADLLVFWDGSAIPSDSNAVRRATVTVPAERFADPVWVDLVTGRIYEIPAGNVGVEGGRLVAREIPYYDAPAVFASRAMVSGVGR